MDFITPHLDFELNPNKFLEWLRLEFPNDMEDQNEEYGRLMSGMCEHSCLYIGMLLYSRKLKGQLKLYSGNYCGFPHYWIGYEIDSDEYFIDLTLTQFIHDAPKVAIIKKTDKEGYCWYANGSSLKNWVNKERGFMFYVNPHTMQPPPIIVNDDLFNLMHNQCGTSINEYILNTPQ